MKKKVPKVVKTTFFDDIISDNKSKWYMQIPSQTEMYCLPAPQHISRDSYNAIQAAKDYQPHPIYNLQFFVDFFKSIPHHLWVAGSWGSGYGEITSCGNGHIIYRLGDQVHAAMNELKKLCSFLPFTVKEEANEVLGAQYESCHHERDGVDFSKVILLINDNAVLEYRCFAYPKERILAALEDLELLLQGKPRRYTKEGYYFHDHKVDMGWDQPYPKNSVAPEGKIKPMQTLMTDWAHKFTEVDIQKMSEAFTVPSSLFGVDLAKQPDDIDKPVTTTKPAVTVTEVVSVPGDFKPMQYTKIMETELVSEQ
jgi:hypothetical protein